MKKLIALLATLASLLGPARAGLYDDCLVISSFQINGDTSDYYNYILRPAIGVPSIMLSDPALTNTGTGQGTLIMAAVSGALAYDPMTESLYVDATQLSYNDLADKPTLGTASTQNSSAFAAASHTHIISDVTGLSSALSAKFDSPSGTTSQYVRGDGSLATFPTNLSAFTNGPGYITGITSGNVTTALGYTPYNATNPNSYVDASGARSSISLTTTGSGAATYNSSTGVLNVPTPAVGALIQRTTITTNASGVATWTFPSSFSSTPKISLAPIDSNSATSIDVKITSKSTTSVTIQVNKIVPVLGILTLLTSTNVGATDVDIIAIEP